MSPTRASAGRGLVIQFRNIRALVRRDLMMLYGRDNIGFAWVILEPLLLTSGVMVIWSMTMGSNKHGVNLVELVLTGYMPLTLWRHITGRSVSIFRRSSPLLYHRSITLFDLLASRGALEFTGTSAALLVCWSTLYAAGIVGGIARLDLLLLGWAMMGCLAFAVGAIIAAITERSDTAERFVQPIQYVIIPVSGAFFMVDWLPSWGQKVIMYGPLVHCYEVFRAGYFGDAIPTHYDLPYFGLWALGLLCVGLVSVERVRKWVQLQ